MRDLRSDELNHIYGGTGDHHQKHKNSNRHAHKSSHKDSKRHAHNSSHKQKKVA
jgi:hypothetical protein